MEKGTIKKVRKERKEHSKQEMNRKVSARGFPAITWISQQLINYWLYLLLVFIVLFLPDFREKQSSGGRRAEMFKKTQSAAFPQEIERAKRN